MSEFSFFRFKNCGLLSADELDNEKEMVKLTEEVLDSVGQACDDSVSKLSVGELKKILDQVRALRRAKARPRKKILVQQE